MQKMEREKLGVIMILCETLMYSLFPIIIVHTTRILPPILFAGLSILTASVTLFVFLLFTKQLHTLKNRIMIRYTLMITLFIVIIPSIFIFVGSSRTSGINTTILLQSEILFTFLIFGLFSNEKITLRKIFGACVVLLGTCFILYNGNVTINTGDLLIIAGTFFYPIGNMFAKKTLKVASPSAILFVRSFVGGSVLILISLFFENHVVTIKNLSIYWPLVLFNAIFIYHISKLLWYEGIKRIDVSKAIPISTGGYPAFSLIFAILLLKEIPTIYQLIGFVAIMFGVFILIKKSAETEPVGAE